MRLKVGDRIYRESYGSIVSVHDIIRLTKTQSISKDGTRFKQDDRKYISVYGRDSWDSSCYSLEDELLKSKLNLQRLRLLFRSIDVNALAPEKLEKIIEISKEL